MKGLKPTLLALCVAGVPPAAVAEIQMLDDSAMGMITGQAGVTIELETKLNIDRFIYTDEGSMEINDIFVGGTNRSDMFSELGVNLMGGAAQETDLLDNVRIEIDILSDGDAIINVLAPFSPWTPALDSSLSKSPRNNLKRPSRNCGTSRNNE